MKFALALVVNSTPQHERFAFDPVSKSRLGQIIEAAHLARLRTRVVATQPHREKLFSFTVGNDVETSSGKSALEICCETLQRVQDLNRRIALYQNPEERIERSGKFFYFLIRVAGIAGGDVAAAKFMDDPRNDRRVRDYLAEEECPNYLIESFDDELSGGANETLLRDGRYQTTSPVAKADADWSAFHHCMECGASFVDDKGKRKISEFAFCQETALQQGACKTSWLAKHPDQCELARPEPRFYQVTPEDVAWGQRQGGRNFEGLGRFTNWCDKCKEYVARSHDGPGGINCEDFIAQRTEKERKVAAKAAQSLEAICAKEKVKLDRQRSLHMDHVAKTMAPYLGAIRDRVILSSRGTVNAAHVEKLDTKMVRKLSQKKDAQTGRKLGVSRARELWNEVTKEDTCQPQHMESMQYQQELL